MGFETAQVSGNGEGVSVHARTIALAGRAIVRIGRTTPFP
jgi:hypothetical protein